MHSGWQALMERCQTRIQELKDKLVHTNSFTEEGRYLIALTQGQIITLESMSEERADQEYELENLTRQLLDIARTEQLKKEAEEQPESDPFE